MKKIPVVPTVDPNAPIDIESALEAGMREAPLERTNRVLLLVGSMLALAIIVASIGIFILAGTQESAVNTPAVTKTQIPTTTNSPLPTPKAFNRSDVTFEVLNGSGVVGAAAAEAKRVSRLGYTVVVIGNAEEEVEGNYLYLSAGAALYAASIRSDFQAHFKMSSTSGTLTQSTASARLIIGK